MERRIEELEASNQKLREENENLREANEKLESEWLQRLLETEDDVNEQWRKDKKKHQQRLQLQEERDKSDQNAQQQANKLRESNAAWSKAVTTVLKSTITGEDIPSDILTLILSTPFSSMQNSSIGIVNIVNIVNTYVFADSYTGLDKNVSDMPRNDLQMVELLRWIMAISTPTGIPSDALAQVVWLEATLLEEIRTHRKSDAWVLLAYDLLSKTVLSNQWPACCIAAVRLARLNSQYPMYDQAAWDNFITDLINQYQKLDIDPLGQACLAYLSLTTSNPTSTIEQNLPAVLAEAAFDRATRIPDIVALLDSHDVASGTDDGVDVVIVRCDQQEIVFSRPSNHTEWDLSVQPITFSSPDSKVRRITWGPGPSQAVNLGPRSRLWRYLNRHHGATGVAALNQEMRKYGETLLERMRNLRK